MSWRASTVLVWSLLAASVVVAEVAARRRCRLVSLGAVIASLTRSSWWRWGLLLAWMWLGWHLFAR